MRVSADTRSDLCVDEFLCEEELFVKPCRERFLYDGTAQTGKLILKVAPLEHDHSVGIPVFTTGRDVFLHQGYHLVETHHGAAHHEIVALAALADVAMLEGDVGKADLRGYVLGHAYLLAYAVDEVEVAFGPQYGQGYAGKAAAGAHVEKRGAGNRVEELRDAERVEHVVLVEVVDILSRDDVDLLVPFGIEPPERLHLRLLARSQGKVFFDRFYAHVIYNILRGEKLE